MAREIKFRAWDKRPYTEHRFWTQEEMEGIGGFYSTYSVTPPEDEFILQQYTGLLDINGKEIYEGDIVKINNDEDIIMDVCFVKGSFEPATTQIYHGRDVEVIGNVFQNPNLLD